MEHPEKDGLLDVVLQPISKGEEGRVTTNITHIRAEEILGESYWSSASEGAHFRLSVLADPQNHDAHDAPIAFADGLTGFPETNRIDIS